MLAVPIVRIQTQEKYRMRKHICLLVLCLMLTSCSLSTSQRETPTSSISLVSTPNTSIIATPHIPTTPPASPTPTLPLTPVPTSEPTVTPIIFASVKVAEKTRGIDTNNRHNVEMISHVETVGSAMDVEVAGNYAYVADGEVGLQVVDISAINELARQTTRLPKQSWRKLPGLAMTFNPHYVDSVHNRPYLGKGMRAYRLTVKDNLVYNAAWLAWQIVDVSDPLAPEEVYFQHARDYAFDIAAAGNYAYIANGTNGVRIIDVSDPTAPVEVSAYIPKDRYVRALTVMGNYLYVVGSGEGLYVVDISDPLNPIEVSTYTIPLLAWNVKVVGKQAFVVWNLWEAAGGPTPECPSGVSIIDVSTPETPIEVGNYCDPGEAMDVAIADNYMYVVGSRGSLRVLDIASLMTPVEVGFYDIPGDARSVTVTSDYIYVADVGGGLFILRFTPD